MSDRSDPFDVDMTPAAATRTAPPAVESPAERDRPDEARRKRVLLVEDNPINRKLARNALRRQDWEIAEATTGEEALDWLEHNDADLILMDLQLPGMDGLEITRRIKAEPRTRDVTVVAVTAHVREADEERAREAGCAGYITKPIRLATFPEQVAAYLSASA